MEGAGAGTRQGSQICEVWFYHLERTALDQALPELLEKTLARSWRALVRSPNPDRVHHLDSWLWSYREDSFLPHGLADEPNPERQPVLLMRDPDSQGLGRVNGANALFLLDDAEPGPLQAYDRCIVMFDGRDEAAVAAARGRWREVKAAGHPCSYWRQSDRGAWEKQA